MRTPRLKFVNQKAFVAVVLGCFAFLAACAETDQNGPVNIGFVGEEGSLQLSGLRLSFAGQHIRGATSQGLVAFDPAGRIVPDLAERWRCFSLGVSFLSDLFLALRHEFRRYETRCIALVEYFSRNISIRTARTVSIF